MTPKEAADLVYFCMQIRRGNVMQARSMAIAALEKQIPRKPIDIGPLTEPIKIGRGIFGKGTTILQKCPVCGNLVNSVRRVKFCEECGQALYWDKDGDG